MSLRNENFSKRKEVRVPPRRGMIKIKIFKMLLKKLGFKGQQGKKSKGGSRSSVVCPTS